jgi:hypothetical protein
MSQADKDKCPLCAKRAQTRFKPFCSRRCADLDLGQWLKGGYAIPGVAAETENPSETEKNGPEEE